MIVYKAYDNQYLNEESAQWAINLFGNPLEQIKENEYNNNEPLYVVANLYTLGSEQVELVFEKNITVLWEGSDKEEKVNVCSYDSYDGSTWYTVVDENKIYFGENTLDDLYNEIEFQGHEITEYHD